MGPFRPPRFEHTGLGAVHVWGLDLDTWQPSSQPVLSPDEVVRAARFRFAADRHRFVRRREALRMLLAWYTCKSPQSLAFVRGLHGKLSLRSSTLAFSVSHAAHRAVYALSLDRPVGVDVEQVADWLSQPEIAGQIVSPGDYVATEASGHSEATAGAVASLWTKKEAVAKLIGAGLQIAPRTISVRSARNGIYIAHVAAPGQVTRDLTVQDCRTVPGFVSAVAANGNDWSPLVLGIPSDLSELLGQSLSI